MCSAFRPVAVCNSYLQNQTAASIKEEDKCNRAQDRSTLLAGGGLSTRNDVSVVAAHEVAAHLRLLLLQHLIQWPLLACSSVGQHLSGAHANALLYAQTSALGEQLQRAMTAPSHFSADFAI